MIELLTVIAIIAILAAILFPVFGTVREQARQSNTLSNLHSIYIGVRQFYDDEQTMPPALLGYAETHDTSVNPPIDRPVKSTSETVTPMDRITNSHPNWLAGYLYSYPSSEHIKDFGTFTNADNTVTDKTAITEVYYPLDSPISLAMGGTLQNPVPVTWQQTATQADANGCYAQGDPDLPDPSYVGQPKYFYKMDSMDIGPMLDTKGYPTYDSNHNLIYELHYSPDWTHQLGAACDIQNSKPVVTQLKYKNPPADRTVITYVTQHTVTSGSPNVIILLLSGTATKINYQQAIGQANTLPLTYNP
jgi:type II secretory pathway pseudopilin PulG